MRSSSDGYDVSGKAVVDDVVTVDESTSVLTDSSILTGLINKQGQSCARPFMITIFISILLTSEGDDVQAA